MLIVATDASPFSVTAPNVPPVEPGSRAKPVASKILQDAPDMTKFVIDELAGLKSTLPTEARPVRLTRPTGEVDRSVVVLIENDPVITQLGPSMVTLSSLPTPALTAKVEKFAAPVIMSSDNDPPWFNIVAAVVTVTPLGTVKFRP